MAILRIPGAKNLLMRILADPALPQRIQKLDPTQLVQLIDQVGLEDCGEIVALATTEQLQGVFDYDLWRSPRPGADEDFDPARFGLWLEVLLELGADRVAHRLVEMDPDFVAMAFSQLIWAVPFDELLSRVSNERGLEKAMESTHSYELEGFFIFSREANSWDAVLATLVELDQNHHSFLIGILETCSALTANAIDDAIDEDGGFSSVLTFEGQLKSDVAYEREKRREAAGFVTPADARAFLKLAESPVEAEDHVTPKHLLDVLNARMPTTENPAPTGRDAAPGTMDVEASKFQNFVRVQEFLAREPKNFAHHIEVLNYLANVLVSGAALEGRPPRPGEAAPWVLKICEAGLTHRPGCLTLIDAFKSGWFKREVKSDLQSKRQRKSSSNHPE